MMTHTKCTKCLTEKPLTEFYENRHRKSGHFSQCKSCVKARQSVWNKTEDGQKSIAKFQGENRERMLAYHAAYGRSEKGIAARKAYQASEKGKAVRKNYLHRRYGGEAAFRKVFRAKMDASKTPEKRAAWSKASHAIRSGKMIRQPCPCGNLHAHAHHEDYSKPLEVTWLCASCHQKLHHQKRMLDVDTY